jgi:hypothetical protein
VQAEEKGGKRCQHAKIWAAALTGPRSEFLIEPDGARREIRCASTDLGAGRGRSGPLGRRTRQQVCGRRLHGETLAGTRKVALHPEQLEGEGAARVRRI